VLNTLVSALTAGAFSEDSMVVLKNILVATDFSEPSEVAMAYGRDLARSYNATLHVLHVIEDVMMRYSPEVGFAIPDLQRDLEKAAKRDLEASVTADDRNTLKVVEVVQTSFNVPAGITEYAKTHAIDLIVVGTHGRGAVKQLLLGSAAERVVRSAPCPVLAVRAKERDFIAPDALVATARA
jgi:nucleotide-binding universal stress UspA family protein